MHVLRLGLGLGAGARDLRYQCNQSTRTCVHVPFQCDARVKRKRGNSDPRVRGLLRRGASSGVHSAQEHVSAVSAHVHLHNSSWRRLKRTGASRYTPPP